MCGKFGDICTCLEKQGYDGVKQWWDFRTELEGKMKRATVDGTPEEVFIYREAFEIVRMDGTRKMKGCKRHAD